MGQRVVFSRDSQAQTLVRPEVITRHKSAQRERGGGGSNISLVCLSTDPDLKVEDDLCLHHCCSAIRLSARPAAPGRYRNGLFLQRRSHKYRISVSLFASFNVDGC